MLVANEPHHAEIAARLLTDLLSKKRPEVVENGGPISKKKDFFSVITILYQVSLCSSCTAELVLDDAAGQNTPPGDQKAAAAASQAVAQHGATSVPAPAAGASQPANPGTKQPAPPQTSDSGAPK